MSFSPNRLSSRRVPEIFADDPRPGASDFVYCKGCGEPLESRDRFTRAGPVVAVMMCDACRTAHGHDLIPSSGSATFCYRCGGPDEIFVTKGRWPETHHVCPRCLPSRAVRYRAGNFAPLQPQATAPGPSASETPLSGPGGGK
ncbi:MAG TPA: hypothetical protein VKX16_03240 [Chloroflexota bacterium]|nr:hypothetical protein [Chloroflexota bacterium]